MIMNTTNIMLGIANISCGVLFILISIPLLKRKIRSNYFYGFRISKAFESEENWFNINAYGAKQMIIWSIPIILIGIISFFVPIREESNTAFILVVGPVTVFPLIAIIKTLIYAQKL